MIALTKRVVITGGVRRLGLAIALGFAERGASLLLIYHSASGEEVAAAAELCTQVGAAEVHTLQVDITLNPGEILAKLPKQWNGIDVLVNNAGVMPKRKTLSELSVENFEATLELNLLAPFTVSKSLAGSLSEGGAIINIASLGGLQIWKERIDYNVSKSALITLTRALARELASRRITVNAIAPGAISLENETTERMGIAAEKIPFGQYGTGGNIAKAVLFFAYDAPYVTGQTLAVDGGRTLLT